MFRVQFISKDTDVSDDNWSKYYCSIYGAFPPLGLHAPALPIIGAQLLVPVPVFAA